jgi:hypothetical protein
MIQKLLRSFVSLVSLENPEHSTMRRTAGLHFWKERLWEMSDISRREDFVCDTLNFE